MTESDERDQPSSGTPEEPGPEHESLIPGLTEETEHARPDHNRGGSETAWRYLLTAALVVVLVIAALALAPPVIDAVNDATEAETTDLTGTMSGKVPVGPGERRVTVALADGVTEDTTVSAGVLRGKPPKLVPARVLGPTTKTPQFTVVLGNPARDGGVVVQWKAAGLSIDGDETADGWSSAWVVVLSLMVVSLLAALAAFVIAVRRRQAGADGRVDVGPELASFLKVAALLMIAALALIAVMLATDDKSLTGLFALLGTIAGYLAGNRSQTTTPGRARQRHGEDRPPGPEDEKPRNRPPEPPALRMSPETMGETRSLL